MKYVIFFIALMHINLGVNAQSKKNFIAVLKAMGNSNFISKPYLQSLQKTKSLAKTQETENKLIQINLFEDGFKKNSINVDGLSINEGGYGFTIFNKPGIKPGTYKTNATNVEKVKVAFSDIGIVIDKKDTMLVLYNYSKTKKILSSTIFVKSNATHSTGEYSGFLQYQVNKILLAGKWVGKEINVEFTKEGKVVGFNDAEKYEVELFTTKPVEKNNELYDAITFTNSAGNKSTFLMFIKGNKLMLYEQVDEGKYTYQLGKLLYTLVLDK